MIPVLSNTSLPRRVLTSNMLRFGRTGIKSNHTSKPFLCMEKSWKLSFCHDFILIKKTFDSLIIIARLAISQMLTLKPIATPCPIQLRACVKTATGPSRSCSIRVMFSRLQFHTCDSAVDLPVRALLPSQGTGWPIAANCHNPFRHCPARFGANCEVVNHVCTIWIKNGLVSNRK